MNTAEKIVEITDKIYSARRFLKRLTDHEVYAQRIKDWSTVIKHTMEMRKLEAIPATMHIIQNLQNEPKDTGVAQMWVLAALAEMLEPES